MKINELRSSAQPMHFLAPVTPPTDPFIHTHTHHRSITPSISLRPFFHICIHSSTQPHILNECMNVRLEQSRSQTKCRHCSPCGISIPTIMTSNYNYSRSLCNSKSSNFFKWTYGNKTKLDSFQLISAVGSYEAFIYHPPYFPTMNISWDNGMTCNAKNKN